MHHINHLFEINVIRKGTNSSKWDRYDDLDLLSFSVADMDFRAPPAVLKALKKSVSHGVFGYNFIPQEYYSSIVGWYKKRHGYKIRKEWVLCSSGVDSAIQSILRNVSFPGDEIIIQEPVYDMFKKCIINLDRVPLNSDLIYKNKNYYINYEDIELKMLSEKCKAMILCNPHNPVGRVWTEEELSELGALAKRYNVTIISDESHCDIVFDNYHHTPFSRPQNNVNCNFAICFSPGKAFNISGLKQGCMIISDQALKMKVKKSLSDEFSDEISNLAVSSLIASYNEPERWLETLKYHIYLNFRVLSRFMSRYFPNVVIHDLQSTYLLWVNIVNTKKTSLELIAILYDKCKIIAVSGCRYGLSGEGFLRINIACNINTLRCAIRRLKLLNLNE